MACPDWNLVHSLGFRWPSLWEIDFTGHERDTCVYKVVHTACQDRNYALESKELSVELHNIIVARHRLGQGYKSFQCAQEHSGLNNCEMEKV